MPPPVLTTRLPLWVTTVLFPVEVRRLRMIAIGMIQITLRSVVTRSSFSG